MCFQVDEEPPADYQEVERPALLLPTPYYKGLLETELIDDFSEGAECLKPSYEDFEDSSEDVSTLPIFSQ